MIVSQLSPSRFTATLRAPGLKLRIGPFVVCIRTKLRELSERIYFFYANHEVVKDEIAEFHLEIVARWSIVHPFSPSIQCVLDGERILFSASFQRAFEVLQQGIKQAIVARVNHFMLFRAASVERNGNAVLLFTPEKYGESGLCAALVYSGYRLLSDEISILDLRSREFIPMPLALSIQNDSIAAIDEFCHDTAGGPTIIDALDTGAAHIAPPAASVERSDETVRAKRVVFAQCLDSEEIKGSSAELGAVKDSEVFILLSSNSPNYEVLGADGFRAVTEIVRSCSGIYLGYSDLESAVTELNGLTDDP